MLNAFKETMLYHSYLSKLLNEINNLIRKIEIRIRSEKFKF